MADTVLLIVYSGAQRIRRDRPVRFDDDRRGSDPKRSATSAGEALLPSGLAHVPAADRTAASQR
jgi:hypothetical protein